MLNDKYELQNDLNFGKIAHKGEIFNCVLQDNTDKLVLVDDKGVYFCDENSIMCKMHCKNLGL